MNESAMTSVATFAPTPQNLPSTLDKIEGAIALVTQPEEINRLMAVMDAAVAYAKRYYKDQQGVIQRAKSLRLQAERRLGEILREMPKASGTAGLGRPNLGGTYSEPPKQEMTLADIGIDKKTSSRAQRLAALPAETFAQVASGAIPVALAIATPAEKKAVRKHAKPDASAKANAIRQELKEASTRGVSMVVIYARQLLSFIESQDEFSTEERDLLSQVVSAITKL